MTYRKTDTLREAIFKTLSQVTQSTKVVDMFKLTEELAEYIERHPLLGVVAKKSFFNCPMHDGGTYTGMEKVHNFSDLQYMVINGLNREHVDDVLSFDGHKYDVKYEAGGHSYIGVSIYIDGEKICYTEDNGSGKLRWVNT